jgi:hypothetical protein
VQQLAQSAGLLHLREYVIGSYVVLYAHSDTEVVLLNRMCFYRKNWPLALLGIAQAAILFVANLMRYSANNMVAQLI